MADCGAGQDTRTTIIHLLECLITIIECTYMKYQLIVEWKVAWKYEHF